MDAQSKSHLPMPIMSEQEVTVTNWPRHWTFELSLGEAGAFFLSYMKWHCVMLAMAHGVFSWLYVLYYFITYGVH